MSLHDRIKEARNLRNITQTELGNIIGVAKTTIAGYEKNREPTAAQLGAIADALDVDVEFLLQDEIKLRHDTKATHEEMENLVKKYRALDKHGKELVDLILSKELERRFTEHKAVRIDNTESIEKIVYVNPAAAGVPLYAEDDFERIEFPANKVPKGTDFGVRISGDSMEPSIPDRAIVWVRKTPEIYDGQVGVFMIDNMAVCKRYHKEGEKIVLQSDNPAYEPIEITNFERFGIVGKVIGMTEEE